MHRHRRRPGHRPRARAAARRARRPRAGERLRRGARRQRRRRRAGPGGGRRDHGGRWRGGGQRRRRVVVRRRCRAGAAGDRPVRRPRRARQQRRDPARPDDLHDDRGRVGRGDPRPPEGHLRAHAPRRRVLARPGQGGWHERRPGHQHHVGVGHLRQPRPVELRRRQGGHRRLHADRQRRAGPLRRHRQRGRPGRAHADDRGPRPPGRHRIVGAAVGGAAGGVAGLAGRRPMSPVRSSRARASCSRWPRAGTGDRGRPARRRHPPRSGRCCASCWLRPAPAARWRTGDRGERRPGTAARRPRGGASPLRRRPPGVGGVGRAEAPSTCSPACRWRG